MPPAELTGTFAVFLEPGTRLESLPVGMTLQASILRFSGRLISDGQEFRCFALSELRLPRSLVTLIINGPDIVWSRPC